MYFIDLIDFMYFIDFIDFTYISPRCTLVPRREFEQFGVKVNISLAADLKYLQEILPTQESDTSQDHFLFLTNYYKRSGFIM